MAGSQAGLDSLNVCPWPNRAVISQPKFITICGIYKCCEFAPINDESPANLSATILLLDLEQAQFVVDVGVFVLRFPKANGNGCPIGVEVMFQSTKRRPYGTPQKIIL